MSRGTVWWGLGVLFINTGTQTELPCSASIRILVALLVVVLSPSPAVSHISSWLSTLYQDPPRSVEKRGSFIWKSPFSPVVRGCCFFPAVSQPVACGTGGQRQLYTRVRGSWWQPDSIFSNSGYLHMQGGETCSSRMTLLWQSLEEDTCQDAGITSKTRSTNSPEDQGEKDGRVEDGRDHLSWTS